MTTRKRHLRRDAFMPLDAPPRDVKILAFDTETREKEPCPSCGGRIEYYGRLKDFAATEDEDLLLWCPRCESWQSIVPSETEEARHSEFVLGCVYDGEKFWDFWDREAMIAFFMAKRWEGYQVWATNLEYDLNALFVEPHWPLYRNYFGGILKGADLILDARRRRSRKTGRMEKVTRKIHFCDTLNQWKGSVDDLGKLLGLPKLSQPDIHLPTMELVEYCRRDTKIVFDTAFGMKEKYRKTMGCEMKGSIASSAMDLFRRRYFRKQHGFRRLNRRMIDFFQHGYFGGRTETFVLGEWGTKGRGGRPVHEGDIRSMYPSIMRDVPVPLLDGDPIVGRGAHLLEMEGMARVRVHVKDQMYPPLPYRHQIDSTSSKLYFPVGTWDGIFTNYELRYALDHGVEIEKIYEIIAFPRSDYVFRDYVLDLYSRRLESTNEIERFMYKIFMNSLYGKFGQIGEILRVCPEEYMDRAQKGHKGWSKYGNGWVAHRKEGKPAIFTNFIWSAYVTAGARCLLHRFLEEMEGLYCDTDSIFTFQDIGSSEELGDMDHKGVHQRFEVLSQKVYMTDTEVKIKGVPKSALGIEEVRIGDEQVFRLRPKQELTRIARSFLFDRPVRFREGMSRGIEPNTWMFDTKDLNLFPWDRKRHFFHNGTSRPLDIQEIEEMRPMWAGAADLPYYSHDFKGTRRKRA